MVDEKKTNFLCSFLHGVRYGLPCRHVLAVAFQQQWRLTLAVIHPRWYKKDRRFDVRVEQPHPYRDMQAIVQDALRELQGHPKPERKTPSESSDQWLRRTGRVSRANEHGRAECRERVCQYVEMQVVAGTIKKK